MMIINCTVEDFVKLSMVGNDSARIDMLSQNGSTHELRAREGFLYTPAFACRVQEAARDPLAFCQNASKKDAVINLLLAPIALGTWRLLYNIAAIAGNALSCVKHLYEGATHFIKWHLVSHPKDIDPTYELHFRMALARAIMVMRNCKEILRNFVRVIPLFGMPIGLLCDRLGDKLLKNGRIKTIVARSMIFEIETMKASGLQKKQLDKRLDVIGYRSHITLKKTPDGEEVIEFAIKNLKQEGFIRIPEIVLGHLLKANMSFLANQREDSIKQKNTVLTHCLSFLNHSASQRAHHAGLVYAFPQIKDKALATKITSAMDSAAQELINAGEDQLKALSLLAKLFMGALLIAALEYVESDPKLLAYASELQKIVAVVADQIGPKGVFNLKLLTTVGQFMISSLMSIGAQEAKKQIVEREKQIQIVTTVLMLGMHLWQRNSDDPTPISIPALCNLIRSNADMVDISLMQFWKEMAKPKIKKELMAKFPEGSALADAVIESSLDAFWEKFALPQFKQSIDIHVRGLPPPEEGSSQCWEMMQLMLGVMVATAMQQLGPAVVQAGIEKIQQNPLMAKLPLLLGLIDEITKQSEESQVDPVLLLGKMIVNMFFTNTSRTIHTQVKNPTLKLELTQLVTLIKGVVMEGKNIPAKELETVIIQAILTTTFSAITERLENPQLVAKLEAAMEGTKAVLESKDLTPQQFANYLVLELLKAVLAHGADLAGDSQDGFIKRIELTMVAFERINDKVTYNKFTTNTLIDAALATMGTWVSSKNIFRTLSTFTDQLTDKENNGPSVFKEGFRETIRHYFWKWFIAPKIKNTIIASLIGGKRIAAQAKQASSAYMFGLL